MNAMTSLPLYRHAALRRIEATHAADALMQRAGQAAADWAASLAGGQDRAILILAGPGNNGGDAFDMARRLRERSFDLCLVCGGAADTLPPDAAAARQRYLAAGGSMVDDIPEDPRWSLIVDGLFGIGLTRPPEDRYARWIGLANRLAERDACPLLALDCPSGLDTETGTALAPTIRASHTLTFIAAKPGLYTADGPDHCGQIRIADLALDVRAEAEPDGHIISRHDFAERLKPRRRNSHKGSFGNAGILGGAKSMVGAAFLAGRAALKLGAGRTYVGLLDGDAPAVDLQQPELMLRRADTLLQADLQALACGPGLGRSAEALRLLEQSLKAPVHLVLDADALNLLAEDGRLEGNLYNRVGPAILTPHPAEAYRQAYRKPGQQGLHPLRQNYPLRQPAARHHQRHSRFLENGSRDAQSRIAARGSSRPAARVAGTDAGASRSQAPRPAPGTGRRLSCRLPDGRPAPAADSAQPALQCGQIHRTGQRHPGRGAYGRPTGIPGSRHRHRH